MLLGGPLMLAVIMMCTLTLLGWSRNHDQVVSEYMALAERNIEKSQLDIDAEQADILLNGDAKLSPISSLALRRVLRMEPNNRAGYAVARYLAAVGNPAIAHQMMRRIAPTNRKGYGPGHAWLAEERVAQTTEFTKEEIEILSNDLSAACSSSVTNKALVQAYANILVLQRKTEEAKELLSLYVDQYPRLNVTVAKIAAEEKDARSFRQSADLAKRLLVENIRDSKTSSVSDFVDLAMIYGNEGELDKAIKVGNVGLQRALTVPEESTADEARVRRVLAMAYLQKYIDSAISQPDNQSEVQLEYLDLAVRADPTYPEAITEVARIVVQGREASTEMVSKLKSSLAQGVAAATTHMLLANHMLENNQMSQAIPHLEQALEIQPDHPIALNNLAYALLDTPASLPRALELCRSRSQDCSRYTGNQSLNARQPGHYIESHGGSASRHQSLRRGPPPGPQEAGHLRETG
ncbi:MAG: hypothetical protein VXZ82_05930 [Planctomycetota bacterium]|nr:hypothetical protein [Planctomycetota bacterium]